MPFGSTEVPVVVLGGTWVPSGVSEYEVSDILESSTEFFETSPESLLCAVHVVWGVPGYPSGVPGYLLSSGGVPGYPLVSRSMRCRMAWNHPLSLLRHPPCLSFVRFTLFGGYLGTLWGYLGTCCRPGGYLGTLWRLGV